EPDADIYTEVLTRTNIGSGPIWMTFTPLKGASEVVRRFTIEKSPDRAVVTMTLDDVDHYSDERKKRSPPAIQNMNGKPGHAAYQRLEAGASFLFRKLRSR